MGQCMCLDNVGEKDHRNLKLRVAAEIGFKEFRSGQRTLSEIEVANI